MVYQRISPGGCSYLKMGETKQTVQNLTVKLTGQPVAKYLTKMIELGSQHKHVMKGCVCELMTHMLCQVSHNRCACMKGDFCHAQFLLW